MLSWLAVLAVLGVPAGGVSSWDKTQIEQVSQGLQHFYENISQLIERSKLGPDLFTTVSREDWGAEGAGCSSQLPKPVEVLVIHHVPGLECHDQMVCSQRLRDLQAHHIHENSGCDVAYNMLVGDDGRVYEGVGWNVQGSHTQGYNNISLGVAFFGTKEGHGPGPAALSSMKGLISYAVQRGHLSSRYTQPLLVKSESCLVPPQKAKPKKDCCHLSMIMIELAGSLLGMPVSFKDTPQDTVCPQIISRSAWGAREAHCPQLTLPAKYVLILHTAGRTCNKPSECSTLVQDLQSFFKDRLGACDIGYNFLVGQDGGAYEGVGWKVQGSRTAGYNDIALGISFMGTFTGTPPNSAALEAAQDLIQCAVAKGYLTPNYLLMGHSDVANTLSPGQALYDIIKTWPHFRN